MISELDQGLGVLEMIRTFGWMKRDQRLQRVENDDKLMND